MFNPGVALGNLALCWISRMLNMRLPNVVFNAIVIFKETLPYGYWFA